MPPPSQCPSIGPIPLCVSGVLNFTDPLGLGRTASIDQDKWKGDEPAKPLLYQGQGCSHGGRDAEQADDKLGEPLFQINL